MATRATDRPLWREVASSHGPLIVGIRADAVLIRLKRSRTLAVTLAWGAIYQEAVLRQAGATTLAKPRRRVARGLLSLRG